MALSDSAKNILKSFGNKAKNAGKTFKNVAKNIDNLGENVEKASKNKWYPLTAKENPEAFFGKDIRLKNKYALGLIGGIGAVSVGGAVVKINERAGLGDIEAGVSKGTINTTFSPTHKDILDYANSSPDGISEFSHIVTGQLSDTALADADAEIVFALHQLRNGGAK